MNVQVFQYQNSPITFNLDGEVMINATQMAKPFSKLPADFLRLDQTQEFARALEARFTMGNPIIKTEAGRYGGTWMHQKLALKFAGWLSPEFELWVYDRIEELLTTGHASVKPLSKAEMTLQVISYLQEDVKRLQEQNILNEATIQAQAPIVQYAQQVLSAEGGLQTSIVAQDHGMTANALNKRLKELRVIRKVGGTWVLTTRYQDKGYAMTRTHPYTDSLGRQQTSISLLWTQKGRELIAQLLSEKA